MTTPRARGTMGGMTVMPREGEWTVADLESLPDDGLQYELLDGVLLVSPAPVTRHQRAVVRLLTALVSACPSDLEVFVAPLDWQPDARTSLQPDLLVVRKSDVGEKNITANLLLAVEVLSPSTRRKDQVFKRSKYEDVGVESLWIVDPGAPAIICYHLVDGVYRIAAAAELEEAAEATHPFPVTIVPARLVD